MAPTIAVAPAPTPAPARAAAVSWGWQQRAAHFFFLLMLFGFPIFSVPCQKGTCTSPLEVVATYGYAKGLVPEEWTKAVLYPATVMLKMEVLMGDEPESFFVPAWSSVLPTWNLTSSIVEDEKSSQVSFSLFPNLLSMFEPNKPNSLNWAFVGACTVCLVGGLISMVGPNKISFWGVLLVLWFIFLEGGKRSDIYAQPMFVLAVVCTLGWVNFRELFTRPQLEEPTAADAKSEVESKKKE